MASVPSWPNLAQGNTGTNVKALQCLLNHRNNNSALAVDGSFGPGCLAAVKNFQSKMAISVDGSVGPTAWQYLFGYNAYPGGGGGSSGDYTDYRGQAILTASQIQLLNEKKILSGCGAEYWSSLGSYGIYSLP